MRVKKINNTNLREIRDHVENTIGKLVKCYTISQLSLLEGIDTRTVKTCGKFLPVRVDTNRSRYDYKNNGSKKPYSIMRIRMDEIKDLFSKRNKGKRLIAE